jgi:hypothetical protein
MPNYPNSSDTITEHVVYRQTHFRIGQWLVGVAFGYMMHRIDTGTNDFKLKKVSGVARHYNNCLTTILNFDRG